MVGPAAARRHEPGQHGRKQLGVCVCVCVCAFFMSIFLRREATFKDQCVRHSPVVIISLLLGQHAFPVIFFFKELFYMFYMLLYIGVKV